MKVQARQWEFTGLWEWRETKKWERLVEDIQTQGVKGLSVSYDKLEIV